MIRDGLFPFPVASSASTASEPFHFAKLISAGNFRITAPACVLFKIISLAAVHKTQHKFLSRLKSSGWELLNAAQTQSLLNALFVLQVTRYFKSKLRSSSILHRSSPHAITSVRVNRSAHRSEESLSPAAFFSNVLDCKHATGSAFWFCGSVHHCLQCPLRFATAARNRLIRSNWVPGKFLRHQFPARVLTALSNPLRLSRSFRHFCHDCIQH